MYRLNDEVLKCRKDIEDLNHKIQEERDKRLRAEDRARVLKEYAEKTKSVSQDVRDKNSELQKAITEMQSRIQKYRRGIIIITTITTNTNSISTLIRL